MVRLTRPISLGHAVLFAVVAVAMLVAFGYALQVRLTDQLVGQCYFNNAKWIATAVQDIRDARRENELAATPGEPARRGHRESRDGALFAAHRILNLTSRPVATIEQTPGGPVFPQWPTRQARLAYCRIRYPRPWPLSS